MKNAPFSLYMKYNGVNKNKTFKWKKEQFYNGLIIDLNIS